MLTQTILSPRVSAAPLFLNPNGTRVQQDFLKTATDVSQKQQGKAGGESVGAVPTLLSHSTGLWAPSSPLPHLCFHPTPAGRDHQLLGKSYRTTQADLKEFLLILILRLSAECTHLGQPTAQRIQEAPLGSAVPLRAQRASHCPKSPVFLPASTAVP